VTPTQQHASFARVALVLAPVVIVLIGMRLTAPLISPILFALVLALIFGSVYAWLLRRSLPILALLHEFSVPRALRRRIDMVDKDARPYLQTQKDHPEG
jgi:predicted PurR-regulated permease PerM